MIYKPLILGACLVFISCQGVSQQQKDGEVNEDKKFAVATKTEVAKAESDAETVVAGNDEVAAVLERSQSSIASVKREELGKASAAADAAEAMGTAESSYCAGRETVEGAEAAIDASLEHYKKRLDFAKGPVVVKTFE